MIFWICLVIAFLIHPYLGIAYAAIEAAANLFVLWARANGTLRR